MENPSRSKSRSKSRSVSLSPVRPAVTLENETADVEKSVINETQSETIVIEKTTEELEKERELSEQLELEKKREAAEKERLRLEVSQLESKIDKNLIARGRQRADSKSESSATDISEDEDEAETERKNSKSTFRLFALPENSSELLRLKLEEKIKEKELAVIKVKEKKIEKKVDMFADSGDEAEEENKSDVKVIEAVDQVMEVDSTEANPQPDVNDASKDGDGAGIAAVIQDDKSKEWNDKDDEFERTLKSLQEIRNTMETMTKEELENALKLHSLDTVKTEADDGRKTPVHLRDIEIPLKSLTEYVNDPKALFKQLFRNINKKEFKHMLPKSLMVKCFVYIDIL